MMSNDYTFDKTMAISKKINEIRGLLKELDNEDSTFLTESFDVCNESLDTLKDEILPYCQPPMPKLETGMFGLSISQYQNGCINSNTLTPFVVVNDQLIYQRGGYDFANPELLRYSKIIRLYNANSFDTVRSCFWKECNGTVSSREIWRDNSCNGDYKFYDEDEDDCYTDDDMED